MGRTLLHTLSQGVLGGIGGGNLTAALEAGGGALVSSLVGPILADELKKSMAASGLDDKTASNLSGLLGQILTTALTSAFGEVGASVGASIYINNFLSHKDRDKLAKAQEDCDNGKNTNACEEAAQLKKLDIASDLALIECQGQNTPSCKGLMQQFQISSKTYKGVTQEEIDGYLKRILSKDPTELKKELDSLNKDFPLAIVTPKTILEAATPKPNLSTVTKSKKNLEDAPQSVKDAAAKYDDQIGLYSGLNQQCASLTKQYSKVGAASGWKPDEQVQGGNIAVGTPIATFNFGDEGNKQYGPPGTGGVSGQSHTGIYLGQDEKGVWLLHQYSNSGGAFVERLDWKTSGPERIINGITTYPESGNKYYAIKQKK
jgi:hypothetical protein